MANRERGRPQKFASPADLEAALDAYIEYCHENKKPILKIGFTNYIGAAHDLVAEYAKKPGFEDVIKRLDCLSEESVIEGGLTGRYNPAMAIFLAKNNHGYRDRIDQEITGKNGAPFTPTRIEIVAPNSKD